MSVQLYNRGGRGWQNRKDPQSSALPFLFKESFFSIFFWHSFPLLPIINMLHDYLIFILLKGNLLFGKSIIEINTVSTPGAPLTYFNDGGVRQRFIFYTPKNPNFSIVYQKKSLLFLAYPKKSLGVFASANFIITSTLVLVKNKTINCAYVIFDLSWWKIQ